MRPPEYYRWADWLGVAALVGLVPEGANVTGTTVSYAAIGGVATRSVHQIGGKHADVRADVLELERLGWWKARPTKVTKVKGLVTAWEFTLTLPQPFSEAHLWALN